MVIGKKLIVTLFFAFSLLLKINSQEYIDAIGIRAGESFGVTYKHFFNEKLAIEAAVMSRWHGIYSMGLIELHSQVMDIKGFEWYIGAGPSGGFWSYNNDIKWLDPGKSAFVFGITATAGLEYNLKDVPLAIGIDWKPAINLVGYSRPWLDEFSVSLKFRLN